MVAPILLVVVAVLAMIEAIVTLFLTALTSLLWQHCRWSSASITASGTVIVMLTISFSNFSDAVVAVINVLCTHRTLR